MNRTQRFFKRLRDELKIDVPLDAYMEVTHAGRNQRSAGAWSSVVRSKSNQLFEIGLFVPIANLLRCPKLLTGDSYGLYVDCGCMGKCRGIAPQKNKDAGQNGLTTASARHQWRRKLNNYYRHGTVVVRNMLNSEREWK